MKCSMFPSLYKQNNPGKTDTNVRENSKIHRYIGCAFAICMLNGLKMHIVRDYSENCSFMRETRSMGHRGTVKVKTVIFTGVQIVVI